MKQKIVVFDLGEVVFETATQGYYRERFEKQGRSAEDLEYFLTVILPKKDRSGTNGGDAKDLIARKVLEHPKWADDIRLFGSEEGFRGMIKGAMPEMAETLAEIK